MILTYNKFALPKLQATARLGIGEPEHYAIPDVITEAMLCIKEAMIRSLESFSDDAHRDLKSVTQIPGFLDVYETTQALVAIFNRVDPAAAGILQSAMDAGRFTISYDANSAAMIGPSLFINPTTPDKLDVRRKTDGSASGLRLAVTPAGAFLGFERMGWDPRCAPKFSSTEKLCSAIQSAFYERALYDVDRLPDFIAHARDEVCKDERVLIVRHTHSWLLAFENHERAMSILNANPFGLSGVENVLTQAAQLHNEHAAPATFIASALYRSFVGLDNASQQDMLSVLFPAADQSATDVHIASLSEILGLLHINDEFGLRKLFAFEMEKLAPTKSQIILPSHTVAQASFRDVEQFARPGVYGSVGRFLF